MVMMTCGENEENAENKCDDYHGDELGLEQSWQTQWAGGALWRDLHPAYCQAP